MGTLSALLLLAAPAQAVVFDVNTTADGNDFNTADPFCDADPVAPGEQCTLRAAIQQAATPPGEDTIDLPAGIYTHSDALGQWNVTSDIVVEGAGASTTVLRQGSAGRVIEVSPGVALELRGVTVRDGVLAAEGAGILNHGELVLRDAAVVNNRTFGSDGGGIMTTVTGARTEIVDSVIGTPSEPNVAGSAGAAVDAGRGGGVAVAGGDLVVRRSLVEANEANNENPSNVNGAGLYIASSGAEVRVADSIVRGNLANEGSGGGLSYADFGGSASLLVERTTVSGNFADTCGGGMLNAGASVRVVDSTLSGNTAANNGGALCGAALEVERATIAANQAPIGAGISLFSGTATITASVLDNLGEDNCSLVPGGTPEAAVASGGHNVDSGSTCGLAGPGDASGADPRLGPLTDNGGPSRTHALRPGSPAIDRIAAGCAAPATDQRGAPRPAGARCDAGAYELARCGRAVVNRVGTPGADVLTGTAGPDAFLLLAGNDRASGAAGNDVACGGPGNDRFFGGPGNDVLLGQAGNDRFVGGPGRDRLVGGPGADFLFGGPGPDRGLGGPGPDRLFGQAGPDRLLGQAGNDRLVGGGGRDLCRGGPGRDRSLGCERGRP